MVAKISNIPENAFIKVVLKEPMHVDYNHLSIADAKGFHHVGEFYLADKKTVTSLGKVTEIVGKYYGRPIHPASNFGSGGLENVVLISPFADEKWRIRVPLSIIDSYERLGSIKDLKFGFGDAE